ncbi:hypothetical protein F5Y00DRAFT_37698 [Daldinia vernicosa]|uniref:uncharacterized protein n=1 Tax=Daldinia vernicosa TaxID=114800 RepID=UPI002007BBAC|nr:uncharacterized protein F5Y00DRAFT_37698 [Daldinia vernicosa]KAI0850412.1 hypothetical protein F5Y00DRAFT_37698 [Daldinia vernicosa]
MPTTGETSLKAVGPQEGFISDDEELKTPSMGGESLFDYFPFEEIEAPAPVNLSAATTEPEDHLLPLKLQWKSPSQSGLKSLPQVHRIVDWIMGRNVIIQEDKPSAKWLSAAGNVGKSSKSSKSGMREGGEVHFNGKRLIEDDFFDIGDVKDICPACTTPYCQALDSLPFKSSLKLGYNDPETHTWLIGDKYVMTEEIDDEWSEEADVTLTLATELIRKATRVPVPNIIAGWKENQKVITITERVPGQRLYDIWWDLRDDQREKIAKEVGRHIDQWRRMTSDRISTLGGGPVRRHGHLFGSSQEGFGPFRSDKEVWSAIHRRLKKKKVGEDLIQILKDYMPESAPCVFTHGDLSTANILIHNGRVSAILGLDNAACLPVWAEYVAVHFCYCKEDEQWKAMLSKHMKSYARAKDWWALWTAVEKNASKKHIAALVVRCQRWQRPPQNKRTFDPELPSEKKQQDVSDLNLMPESHLRPPAQNRHHKTYSPYRAALSRKLLKGRHFSELLNDVNWESAVHGGSEEGDMVGGSKANSSAVTEPQTQATVGVEKDLGRFIRETRDEAYEAKRVGIERWLSESERGREYFPRPLVIQRTTNDKEDVPPQMSPVKDPPWRERDRRDRLRSFERRDNDSKGLRPFSLALSLLSDNAKEALREVDKKGEDGNESHTREQFIEETLRSLESSPVDPIVDDITVAPIPQQGKEEVEDSVDTEKKRSSIFTRKTSPGLLYLTLANAAAEGKSKRYRRSFSEEETSLEEGHPADE